MLYLGCDHFQDQIYYSKLTLYEIVLGNDLHDLHDHHDRRDLHDHHDHHDHHDRHGRHGHHDLLPYVEFRVLRNSLIILNQKRIFHFRT